VVKDCDDPWATVCLSHDKKKIKKLRTERRLVAYRKVDQFSLNQTRHPMPVSVEDHKRVTQMKAIHRDRTLFPTSTLGGGSLNQRERLERGDGNRFLRQNHLPKVR